MKISFLDFWDGFEPTNNFLYFLLRDIYNDIEIVSPNNANVIIFSLFGSSNTMYNHCKKIFFTGENRRPDFSKCDFSISFDFDDYGGRNIRIPLWYYYIDWFNVGSYGNPNYLIPEKYLYQKNEFSKNKKKLFCATVYSNPVNIRNIFVNKLSTYKNVDCFGKLLGFKQLPDGEKIKMEIISNYKFNICFENSIYSGYYTEKLIQAKRAGCIPIYYSDNNVKNDFNTDSFLNLKDYSNIEDFVEKIIEIDQNPHLYEDIRNEKLFLSKLNLDFFKYQLSKILS